MISRNVIISIRISKSIQKLENNLNTKLFVRTSRGVSLTDEGETLYKHTKRAFEELYIGEKTIGRMNELGTGHIKFGASTTLCKYVLLPYLKEFVQNNPHINITISSQSSYKTLELLESNDIDIGLVNEPDSLGNLDFYKVGEIHDIFVATESYLNHLKIRENYQGSQRMDTRSIFETGNIMLLDEMNLTRKYIDEYLNENNIKTNQLLEVTSMDLLIDFAKTGLGVACVIKEFVKPELSHKSLLEISLPINIAKRNIGFIYKTNIPQNNATNLFLDYYKKK